MIVDVWCYIHLRLSCYTQSNSHHFLPPFFFHHLSLLSSFPLSVYLIRYIDKSYLHFHFIFMFASKCFLHITHSPSFVFSQFLKQPKTRPVSSSIIFFWENNTDPRMCCASLNAKYVHKIHL